MRGLPSFFSDKMGENSWTQLPDGFNCDELCAAPASDAAGLNIDQQLRGMMRPILSADSFEEGPTAGAAIFARRAGKYITCNLIGRR